MLLTSMTFAPNFLTLPVMGIEAMTYLLSAQRLRLAAMYLSHGVFTYLLDT